MKNKAISKDNIREVILSHANRVVIKLGSYVLTTPSWKLDKSVFSDVVSSIAEIKKRGVEFILVTSGAIASGMGKLGLQERPKTISGEQAIAAIGQIDLMRLYERLFRKHGIQTAQILLTHNDLGNRKRFLNARHTLNRLLEYGAVPVINENDTTVVEEIRFGDNDYLSSLIINLVQADLLIILTDIDGCYDRDPHVYPDAEFIPLIKNVNNRIEQFALGTRKKIARGGMATKIKAARTAARYGVATIIANGKSPGIVSKIFSGEEVGTLILPEQNKLTSKKHWIAYTLKPHGCIYVDDGAKTAITENRKSLLPKGIIKAEGDFDAGEMVICRDKENREFARGLTSYSSYEINKIKGLDTGSIEKVLGYCCNDIEVINRDNLVVTANEHN